MVPPDPRGHPVLLAAAGGEFGVADVQVLRESSRDGGSVMKPITAVHSVYVATTVFEPSYRT